MAIHHIHKLRLKAEYHPLRLIKSTTKPLIKPPT